MQVRDIMDRDLTSLAEDSTLLQAIALMAAHKVSGLPVLNDDGRVVGFISEKDILRAVIPGYLGYMDDSFAMPDIEKIKTRIKLVGNDTVRDYMSRNAIVFDEYETISSAIVTLFKKNVRRAPVVAAGSLVGVVDREEILKGFVHDNFEEGEISISMPDSVR